MLNPNLYLRDPQETALGKKILEHSILLMDKLGFENFNFKKLAHDIQSTEASVYRYFENKHKLLLYLISWYWQWVHYLIDYNMHNVSLPLKRFKIYIHFLVHASKQNNDIDYINKSILHNLVVNEGLKVYRTIYVDEENQQDLYRGYKQLVTMLADIILEINSDFKYPRAMATNFFEMVNNHIYFSEHLPQLTDIKKTNDRHQAIENLLIYYSEKLLGIDLQSV